MTAVHCYGINDFIFFSNYFHGILATDGSGFAAAMECERRGAWYISEVTAAFMKFKAGLKFSCKMSKMAYYLKITSQMEVIFSW